MPVSVGDYCSARHSSLNRHNVTKTGNDWSRFSHRGPANGVTNDARSLELEASCSNIAWWPARLPMSCWQLTVLRTVSSRVKVRHQTSTRLSILRGMSGEGERVNLPIAGGLGIASKGTKKETGLVRRGLRGEVWTGLAASSCDSWGKTRRSCKLQEAASTKSTPGEQLHICQPC